MVRILKGVRIKGLSVIGKIKGKIAAKLNQAFGLRGKAPKPAPPNTKVVGHRGIAAGSLKRRQKLAQQFYQGSGIAPYTAAEVAKWRNLGGETVQGFLEDEEPLFVHSSNVIMAQYFGVVSKMLVEFRSGASYLYSNVSLSEALSFAQAQSKGGWIWDNLRVRGSKTQHRKPYVKTSGMSRPPKLAKPFMPPSNLPPFEEFL